MEEPTAADDYAGHARIRNAVDTPIQLGESWWDIPAMTASLAAMVDLIRIGGVSGWMAAAALAHAHGLPMSSHLVPEISAHLLPISPSTRLLEYLDVARRCSSSPRRYATAR